MYKNILLKLSGESLMSDNEKYNRMLYEYVENDIKSLWYHLWLAWYCNKTRHSISLPDIQVV